MLETTDKILIPSGYYQVTLNADDNAADEENVHAFVGNRKFVVTLDFTDNKNNKNLAGKSVKFYIDLDVADIVKDEHGFAHAVDRHPYRIEINYDHANQLLGAVGSNMTVKHDEKSGLPDNFAVVNELKKHVGKTFTLIVRYRPSKDCVTFPVADYRFGSLDETVANLSDTLIDVPIPDNSVLIDRFFNGFSNKAFINRLWKLGINQFVIGDGAVDDNCFKALCTTVIEQMAHERIGLQSELAACVVATRLVRAKRHIEEIAMAQLLIDCHEEFPLLSDEQFTEPSAKDALRISLDCMRETTGQPLHINNIIAALGKGTMTVDDIPQAALLKAMCNIYYSGLTGLRTAATNDVDDVDFLKTSAITEKPVNTFAEFAGNKVGTEFSGAIKNTVD